MTKKQTLGELLVHKGLVSQEDVDKALGIQSGGNRRLGHILVKMGLISDEDLFETLSDQKQIPVVSIADAIDPEALAMLPGHLCRRYGVLPLKKEANNVLVLAMVNPLDEIVIDEIDTFTGMIVRPVLARQSEIQEAVRRHKPPAFSDITYQFRSNPVFISLAAMIFVLMVVVGVLVWRDYEIKKYGIASEANGVKVFSNHELLIGVEGERTFSLIGHGPYAKGFYSVVFEDPDALKEFVELKREHFSQSQYKWICWVLDNKLSKIN